MKEREWSTLHWRVRATPIRVSLTPEVYNWKGFPSLPKFKSCRKLYGTCSVSIVYCRR